MSSKRIPKMYNLNINVTTNLPSFLGLDGQANTPKTPEIVNHLYALTNPFEVLEKTGGEHNSPGSEESCSGNGSPLGSPTNSPPSVQHTRSQLIKEGLKLTIQTKRKQSGSDTKEDLEEFESKRTKREELTAEDEERRKRRRERNKIAATKCRMKKREKTANLVAESEILETQNIDLKSQIQDLEKERRKLMDMLSMHSPTCVKNGGTPDSGALTSHTQFQEYVSESEQPYLANFETDDNFSETGSGFEIGSTNGTSPLNPFSKDPTFPKMIDMPTPSSSSSSPSSPYPGRGYTLPGYVSVSSSAAAAAAATVPAANYYQQKQKTSDENRVTYEFPSDDETIKKSGKRYAKTKDDYVKKGNDIGLETHSHHHHHHHHQHQQSQDFRTTYQCNTEDAERYRPNGIIDGNFFDNRTDIFSNNDYSTFGANPLDNGCMA